MPVSRIVALWTQTQRAIIPAYHDHVIQVRNDGFFNAYGQVFINGSLVFPTDIKYVIEIDCEGGTAGSVILKKTTSFEEDFIAYFHVESVIQDFLETDNEEFYLGNTHQASSINSIHLIQNFSKNKANLRRFTFLVRCEFVVDNVTYSTQNFTMPDNLGANRYYNQDYYFWNAVADKLDGETFQHITDYYQTDSSSKTLTTFPTGTGAPTQKIQKTQHHTVGFFCGGHQDHSTDSFQLADMSSVKVTLFNASGVQVEQNTLLNSDANGGAAPVANQFFSTSGNATRGQNGLLYLGTGTANLAGAGAITSSNMEIGGTYKVEFLQSDGTTQAYEPLTFEITDDDCKGFETIRLAWLNTLGTWDYFNFSKLSTQTYTSKRATYKQNYGHETNNTFDGWGANTHLGGQQVFNNTVKQTIEANTDFITEEEAAFLKGCFTSPKVQWQTLNSRSQFKFVPVVVKEKDYVVRTSANDKLIQYVIELEVGHDYRVQRG